MLWSLGAIIVLALALPSLGYMVAAAQNAPAATGYETQKSNPRSDMWRGVRESVEGTTNQSGPYTTNTLINNSGEIWREIRSGRDGNMGPLKTYGGWVMLLSLIAIAVFFAVFGRNKIEGGRDGMTVPRWTMFERVVHWFVAISFIVLAITGLSLLFGRVALIPLFGAKGFSAYAQLGMTVHNFVGPAFGVALVLMILRWFMNNIPSRVDLEWFKQRGGYFGGGHASSGKLNAGEKAWFWGGVVVLGLAVTISGFILDFPNWGFQDRTMMATAHVIHAGAAMLWIAGFFGHAYMGTLGTEGVLEGMTTGRVDTAWAKQHHDLWYADLIAKGVKPEPTDSAGAMPSAGAKATRPGH
jgi:formate dehydrogenase subunit gamma